MKPLRRVGGRRHPTHRDQDRSEERTAQAKSKDHWRYDNHGTLIALPPAMKSSDRTLSAVPASAVLDNWARVEWTDGCQVDAVPVFQSLTVATLNTFYEMIVLDGRQGLVRVRGGHFFPEWREVLLAGCSLGGSFLKLRGIYAGFCMELRVGDETIITSPVRRLTMTHFEGPGLH